MRLQWALLLGRERALKPQVPHSVQAQRLPLVLAVVLAAAEWNHRRRSSKAREGPR